MVEMHLLSVNFDFRYDPIYALGVVTTFDRFMLGYQPQADKESIFNALCRSVEGDPQQYRQDAERMVALSERLPQGQLKSLLCSLTPAEDAQELQQLLKAIAHNKKFKYSRLFAVGLYTLLETADPELVKDEKQCQAVLKESCDTLNLPYSKLEKDLDLYRGNLEKMEQARQAIEDAIQASRKQRERRTQEKDQAHTSETAEGQNSTTDEASSGQP